MTLEEQLLYTTLRIECFDNQQTLYSVGTGFLLERPVFDGASKIYLVSNKHVLVGADTIAITFTNSLGDIPDHSNQIRFPINNLKGNVAGHPDPNIDIAVLECTGLFLRLPNQLFFKCVSYTMLADFTEPELSVAQNVLFVGYPDNRYDVNNNLPLVRQGLIASHPKFDFNGNPVFVIDAQVFPGSSGSPVFIDLSFENIKNGQIVLGEKKVKMLGIVSQTMIRNNRLMAIPAGTNYLTQEVIGLGIVFKSTAIRELIDSLPTNS